MYVEIVEMFKTRKEPRTHQNILKEIAILEAMEKSAKNEKWEKVMSI
jgi:hypothetical protein